VVLASESADPGVDIGRPDTAVYGILRRAALQWAEGHGLATQIEDRALDSAWTVDSSAVGVELASLVVAPESQNQAEALIQGEAIRQYRRLSGDVGRLIRMGPESMTGFAGGRAALASRVPTSSDAELAEFALACNAAWLTSRWNADTSFSRVVPQQLRPTAVDAAELFLSDSQRLLNARHRSELEEYLRRYRGSRWN
jgi:hypothetical protein